jgi:hypothetical protein
MTKLLCGPNQQSNVWGALKFLPTSEGQRHKRQQTTTRRFGQLQKQLQKHPVSPTVLGQVLAKTEYATCVDIRLPARI